MYMIIRKAALLDAVPLDYDKPIFCDTETCIDEGKSKGGLYGRIRLFQLYQEGWEEAILVDCFSVTLQHVLDRLVGGHLVFHNASYDLHTINLYTDGTWYPARVDDTIYLSRLAFSHLGNRFDFYKCLGYGKLIDEIIVDFDKKENQRADWSGNLTETMKKYAACDVLYLWLLYEKCKHCIDTEAYQLDIYNLKYAIEYSRRGIPVDEKRVQEKMGEAVVALEELLSELPVNPNSPKQVTTHLGSESSDKKTLTLMKIQGNEIAGKILDARHQSKTISYLKNYSRPVVYGFFNPNGAVTNRFACSGGDRFDHANLQQIPHRLKQCMCAPEGYVFIYSDYSGIELKMATAWIADPTMIRLLSEGLDIHAHTGEVVYNKPGDTLDWMERTMGKMCNFLFIFGGSPKALQDMILGWAEKLIPLSECKRIMDAWFEEYHYFKEWHDMTKKSMRVYGYVDVETALGHKVRTLTFNDAVNTPIQGSSAECTKKALNYLKTRYPDENLINTIHDANIIMCKEEESPVWAERLDECMIDGWKYVTKDLAEPNIDMPPGAKINRRWEFE